MCFSYAQKSMLFHGLIGVGTHIQEGTQFLKEPMKRGLILQISNPTNFHSTNGATKVPV